MSDGDIALHIQTHIPVFTIYSSHGELMINLEDGKVYHCELYPEGEDIDKIERVDIKEYEMYHNRRIEEGEHLDILDFGTWQKDGTYQPPEMEWREQHKVGTDSHKRLFKGLLAFEFKRRTGLDPNDVDLDNKFERYYEMHTKEELSETDIVTEYIEKYDLDDLYNRSNWNSNWRNRPPESMNY